MKNNAKIEDSILEGFEELLTIGLNSSSEILSKLLNNDVELKAEEIVSEKIDGLESFGVEAGVVVALNLSGALNGKTAIVIQNNYAKGILNILMNSDDDNEDSDDDIDEISMGTFKELVGQMASAFSGSLTSFFGAEVKIEAENIHDLSEECDEIAEIFGCGSDAKVYSIISKFSVGDELSGSFNIEVDYDTFNFTSGKLNMIPENEDESMFLNAIAGGNNPMDLKAVAEARKAGKPVSVVKDSISVQSAQFPNFSNQGSIGGISLLQGNMDLLMDVPLSVTVEIGKTRRKMRDIMEFTQGTVIDLEKQAGAPVDIVVNGQLIARGDVVVIDDNFGVRITEIVGNNGFVSKE